MVLLALRAVLQLLPGDVADAELLALQIAPPYVLEIAKALAMAVVLVAVVIYVQVVLAVVINLVAEVAKTIALLAALLIAPLAKVLVPEPALVDVLRVQAVLIHAQEPALVDAWIRVRAVEALALTIVRDALAAVLVVVLVLDAPRVPALALAAMDVVTNALLRASSLALDVLVAVHAEHHVGQAVNPLVVILVLERAVMGVLIHAEHAVLLVQQAVLQIAEQLARVPVMEA